MGGWCERWWGGGGVRGMLGLREGGMGIAL